MLRRRTAPWIVVLTVAASVACAEGSTGPGDSAACGTTVGTIAVGDTVLGTLTTASCRLADRSYADRWMLNLPSAAVLTLDMMSTDFDAYLVVQDGTGAEVVRNDDGGDSTDARITFGFPAGNYIIVANVYHPNVTGAYSLSVQ